jgi:hypothetical protein
VSKRQTDAGERVEGMVLVLIVLTVGGLAGAASFTHVHDWTMANSPAHTGDWFGWANAAISELIPVAALLIVRRRRRAGGSIGYPMFLLIAAVILSLSAQLAVAKPGLSGALLSAVPALAFLGLSKLVFSMPASTEPTGEPVTADAGLPVQRRTGVPGSGPTDPTVRLVDEPPAAAQRHDQRPAMEQPNHAPAVERPARPGRVTEQPARMPAVERVDQGANGPAVPVDPVRPVVEPRRPRLVPVPAAAFPARTNGTPYNPSAPSESPR